MCIEGDEAEASGSECGLFKRKSDVSNREGSEDIIKAFKSDISGKIANREGSSSRRWGERCGRAERLGSRLDLLLLALVASVLKTDDLSIKNKFIVIIEVKSSSGGMYRVILNESEASYAASIRVNGDSETLNITMSPEDVKESVLCGGIGKIANEKSV
jgi:hypothetical protein